MTFNQWYTKFLQDYSPSGLAPQSVINMLYMYSKYVEENAVRGDKGDKGDRGEQGIQGPQGIQGVQGIQGEIGPQGIQGEQGEQGTQGDKGDKGDRGPSGDGSEHILINPTAVTLSGPKAVAITLAEEENNQTTPIYYLTGLLGGTYAGEQTYFLCSSIVLKEGESLSGLGVVSLFNPDTGSTTPIGGVSCTFESSLSGGPLIYLDFSSTNPNDINIQYVDTNSFLIYKIVATQGIQGDKGDKGDRGEQGIQGQQGEAGSQGIQGIQGVQGAQGEQGEQGEKGEQGIQGEKGESGTNAPLFRWGGGEATTYTFESSGDGEMSFLGGNTITITNAVNGQRFIGTFIIENQTFTVTEDTALKVNNQIAYTRNSKSETYFMPASRILLVNNDTGISYQIENRLSTQCHDTFGTVNVTAGTYSVHIILVMTAYEDWTALTAPNLKHMAGYICLA